MESPSVLEETSQSQAQRQQPKWRQRRYQYACLALVAFIAAATCGGLLAARSVKGMLSKNDEQENSSALNSPVVQNVPSPTPSEPPSRLASEIPSALPTVTSSRTPTVTASQSPSSSKAPSFVTPTISTGPSVIPTVFPSASMAPSPSAPDVFSLYVMGDVPYASWEEIMLISQLADMTAYTHPTAMLTVHVGDIQKPTRSLCAESTFFQVSQYLLQGPLPTFVIPGDNDWADCPNPYEALGYFHKYFDYFEQHWTTTTVPRMAVEYNGTYPEMWRFTYNEILFLSVQLIDSKNEMTLDDWNARMQANIQWIWTALGSLSPPAVIIFGQGQFGNETKEFFEGIHPLFAGIRSTTPVMYIHGDGHKWDLNDKVQTQLNWPMFIDVQVDQGAFADPIIVEFSVNPYAPLVQEHDLQYVFANGMIRIDRQRGRYPTGSDGRATTDTLPSFPLN